MTLTRLIPTLRASIPDPLDHRVWPAGTSATTVDVLVDGISLLRVAELGGTPSVTRGRLAASVGIAAPLPSVVVMIRVAAVAAHADGEPVVFVDGDPDAAGAVWREARLIGRVSTARDRAAVVRPAPPYGTSRTRSLAQLPRDVRVGDLLAVPCSIPVPVPPVSLQVPPASVPVPPVSVPVPPVGSGVGGIRLPV